MAANSVPAAASPIGPVTTPWWVNLIAGIALAILGLLLLSAPGATTVVLIQFLGIYWLVDGIVRLVSIFIDHSGWGWKLLMGVLGIIAGIVVLQHPLWSTILIPATIVIFIGILGAIFGVIQVIAAFRGAGWVTGVLGAISIVFGLLLLFNWQLGTLTLPFTLGIFALAGGIVAAVASFGMRSRAA
jgi:uncharacterized membrane protein HdeD (DUF308 family)